MKLHYFPGACSMAAHVVLEELAEPYELCEVALLAGEQRSEAYLQINPRGQVPALEAEGLLLTENAAILTYLARRFPEAGLLSKVLGDEARCLSLLTWISNTLDPAYRQAAFPVRVTTEESARASVAESGKKRFWKACQVLDRQIGDGPWIMGERLTVSDPYALVYCGWGLRMKLPMGDLPAYGAEGSAPAAACRSRGPDLRKEPASGGCVRRRSCHVPSPGRTLAVLAA
jgi:glutathione S-transferase